MNKPLLITDAGKKALGALLRASREEMGWSLDDLTLEVRIKTGEKLSKTAINSIERGFSNPTWDSLATIAAVGYAKNPKTGKPLSVHDMFDICAENFNPKKARRGGIESPKAASSEGNYNTTVEMAYN